MKISEAQNRATLADTDVAPAAVPGDNTAYKFTLTSLWNWIKAHFAGETVTFGTHGTLDEGHLVIAAKEKSDWHIVGSQVVFDGNPDDVMFIGYNITGAGGLQDPAEPPLFIGMESDYWYTAQDHVMEWYVEAGAGENTRRPFMTRINRETWAVTNHLVGLVDFLGSDGVTQVIKVQDAGDVYFYQDQRFYNATDGPILKDRSTGTSYRLKVDNGTLGVEAV